MGASKKRIFLSSTQRDLSVERKAVVDLVAANPQLSRFFTTFAFEFDVPVQDKRADEVYLTELAVSDVYVCIIGDSYGSVTADGVSATECEYDEATRLGLPRFVFIKGEDDSSRDPRERSFIQKVSPGIVRCRFKTTEELLSSLTLTLDAYLAESKVAYAGFSYEEEPVGAWGDLDEAKIRWFVLTAREKRGFPMGPDAPMEKILEHLRMVTDGVPNRAAMLCFGRSAHLVATSPGVKCVLWYGRKRTKPAGSYKWFEGNLFEVSDKAIEFVKEKLNLRIGGHTNGAQSDDTFEIDERIVTEMINNAIAHRDYASSATVQVELFKDRLVVFSPGPLHPDMKFEMLSVDHQSYATNPIIARALYYVQYIEEIGSGTTDIFAHCAEQGLEPPVFEADARHVSVTVMRPVFDDNGRKVGRKPITNPSEPITNPSEPITNARVVLPADFDQRMASNRKDLRERAKRIWLRIAKDPNVTVRELAQECGFSLASTQGALNALKEGGLLKKTGSTRNGKWCVVASQKGGRK